MVLGEISGSSQTALFLALAPGGLAEMSIIALSFGTAAAFVSTHHIVRIILLVVIAPTIFKFLYMKKSEKPKENHDFVCGGGHFIPVVRVTPVISYLAPL